MDNLLTVIAVILLGALGYWGLQDWRKATTDEKLKRIEQLVQAAEQHLKNRPGTERFKWVMDRLMTYYKTNDTGELMDLVEAAVFRVNAMKAKPAAQQPIDDAGGAYWLGSGHHTE